jgi:hypothetical protein
VDAVRYEGADDSEAVAAGRADGRLRTVSPALRHARVPARPGWTLLRAVRCAPYSLRIPPGESAVLPGRRSRGWASCCRCSDCRHPTTKASDQPLPGPRWGVCSVCKTSRIQCGVQYSMHANAA